MSRSFATYLGVRDFIIIKDGPVVRVLGRKAKTNLVQFLAESRKHKAELQSERSLQFRQIFCADTCSGLISIPREQVEEQ